MPQHHISGFCLNFTEISLKDTSVVFGRKKNPKVFLTFLFLLPYCLSTSLFAQEKNQIEGQVIADSIKGFQINIINLTAQTGTVSEPGGHFKVWAALGDTLYFSAIQYQPKQVKITREILAKSYWLVHLEKAVNVMPTVHLSSIDLSGDLKDDLPKIESFNQAEVGFGIRRDAPMSIQERQVHYLRTNGGLAKFISVLSGRDKMILRQLKYIRIEAKREKIIQLLTPKFFLEELKLPEYKINNFIYYCFSFKDFPNQVNLKNIPYIQQFLKEKIKIYKPLQQEE